MRLPIQGPHLNPFDRLTALTRRLLDEGSEPSELAFRVLHLRRIIFEHHPRFGRGSSNYISLTQAAGQGAQTWTREDQMVWMWELIRSPEMERAYSEGLKLREESQFPFSGDLNEIQKLTAERQDVWSELLSILRGLALQLPSGSIRFVGEGIQEHKINYEAVSRALLQEISETLGESLRGDLTDESPRHELEAWVGHRYRVLVQLRRANQLGDDQEIRVEIVEGESASSDFSEFVSAYDRSLEDLLYPDGLEEIVESSKRREVLANKIKKDWRKLLKHFQILRLLDYERYFAEIREFRAFAQENYDPNHLRHIIMRIYGPHRNGIPELHPDLVWDSD